MSSQPGVVSDEAELFAEFCHEFLLLEDGSPLELYDEQLLMLSDFFAGTTETLILVPKKNGKTSLMAALALFHLWDTEDAECVIAAASRDQASIMLRQASGFIRRSDWLQTQMKVNQRVINSVRDSGRIRILASDADTADGVIPTLALIDEWHRHTDKGEMYGVFRRGLGPRKGRMITISTAGDDEASPLGEVRHRAHQFLGVARDGCHLHARSPNGKFAMHEWALDVKADRSDMSIVKRANPAPWQTLEELAERYDSPSETPWGWARYACGVWVQGEDSAISPGAWDGLHESGVSIPQGADVYVGLDLAWKGDTTAIVPLYWESESRRVVSDVEVIVPPGDGGLLDDRLIVDRLLWLKNRFNVVAVVYDPNAGGQQMVQQLDREYDFTFVEHSQDNSPIALADSRLMEAIRTRSLVHDGDRVLRQHVLNVVERPLGGEKFKFDRPRRGPRKPNDALRALSMAHSVAVAAFEKPAKPVAQAYFF